MIYTRMYKVIQEYEELKGKSIEKVLDELSKTYKIFRNGRWSSNISTKKKEALLKKLNIKTF